MINLLPPKEKQILLKEKQFREILIFGTVVFLSLSFLSFILFFIEIDLRNKLSFQRETFQQKEKEFEVLEIKNLEKEIESLNQTLLKLNSFYQDKFYLTDILGDLAKAVPSGLYLTSLSYNKEKREITISGFAPEREILTEFKAHLERVENFQEVYFPPSNWILPADISFFASFKLDNR